MDNDLRIQRPEIDNTKQFPGWQNQIVGASLVRDPDHFDSLQPNKVWWRLVLTIDIVESIPVL